MWFAGSKSFPYAALCVNDFTSSVIPIASRFCWISAVCACAVSVLFATVRTLLQTSASQIPSPFESYADWAISSLASWSPSGVSAPWFSGDASGA